MDRLSPLDSSFLHVEDGITHMHIASSAIFEGPSPPYEHFVDLVASKLPLLPRYRQTVRFVPGASRAAGLGRRLPLQPRLPRAPHGATTARR